MARRVFIALAAIFIVAGAYSIGVPGSGVESNLAGFEWTGFEWNSVNRGW